MDVREKLVELIAQKVCDTWSEACDEWMPHDCGNCYANDCHIAEVADHLIDNGVTVQEWISVKDRLPNLDEAVLVLAEYLHIKTNYYEAWSLFKCESGETIWVDKYGDGHNLTEVTHWMPLPTPPKGE